LAASSIWTVTSRATPKEIEARRCGRVRSVFYHGRLTGSVSIRGDCNDIEIR
jgi:hypothetical protein